MKLLDKKDVFEQKRLQEQQMVIKGAQISDLVNKHQKKLNEAKQEFVSEVEKQKQVFDEMVESYMAKLGVLKSEVAELTIKRQELLEPVEKEVERLKTVEITLLDREEAVKAKFDLVEASARQVAIHEKTLKQKELDIVEQSEASTLNFLNSHKRLLEAESAKDAAKKALEEAQKVKERTLIAELEKNKELLARETLLSQERENLDAITKAQKTREKSIKALEKQVNDRYATLLRAEAEKR